MPNSSYRGRADLLGVNDEWGGRPYQDLLNLIKYLEKLPYIDQDKAILAGASYSGYLVSWIFGQEIAKKVRLPNTTI